MFEICTLPFVMIGVLIAKLFPPAPPREPDGYTVERQEAGTEIWGHIHAGTWPEQE